MTESMKPSEREGCPICGESFEATGGRPTAPPFVCQKCYQDGIWEAEHVGVREAPDASAPAGEPPIVFKNIEQANAEVVRLGSICTEYFDRLHVLEAEHARLTAERDEARAVSTTHEYYAAFYREAANTQRE